MRTIIKLIIVIFNPACAGFNIVNAQWNTNPSINTSVAIAANDQQDVRVAGDNKGGAIATWCDYRNNIANGDIYAQRINAQGVVMWTANGVSVCTDVDHQTTPAIIEDSMSGAIIVWQDWRNGDRDIYAQRVDSMGVIKWAANGAGIIVKSYEQQNPKHVSDGSNGAIIVWQDSINGNWDVYVQRINSNGTAQWTSGGVAICTAIGDQINPKIETDNQGGAIITWQDKRNGADYDIYAQRVNSSGATQWTTNGVSICSVTGTQSNPKIEPDGSGGAIIAWQDKRNGSDYDVYAQRINASGIVQWTTNGVSICSATGSQSAIDLATENINGAIITWKDARNGTLNYDIYAQYVNLSGTAQWVTNGVAISTAISNQIAPNIVGDGIGGSIIVWESDQNSNVNNPNSDTYAQRINASGMIQWVTNGVAVATADSNQTSVKHVSDGNGGAIFVWQDKRSGNFDIYAHHLYSDGTASINYENQILEGVAIQIFPNPFTISTTIIITGKKITNSTNKNIELIIYDITGKKHKKIVPLSDQFISEDKIEIKLTGDNLHAGIYFYQLILCNNDEIETIHTGKFIVINPSNK
ncbi:MAG: T9SS type A sorting domain-containing protein [Bacteroidales bacterium]